MLSRAETLANEMVDENDIDAKGRLWEQVSRELFDVLTKTENMTRWLKGYEKEKEKEIEEDGLEE